MQRGRAFLAYLCVVVAGAALLAPQVWSLGHTLAEHYPALAKVADAPLQRYLSRCFLVLALLGAWPLSRALGGDAPRGFGLTAAPRWRRRIGIGFATACLFVLLGVSVYILLGARSLQSGSTPAELASGLGRALVSAAAVAVLEESLFRGVILLHFIRMAGMARGLWLGACFFALLHVPGRPGPDCGVGWFSGFMEIGRMFAVGAGSPQAVPQFLSILLLGVVLGEARVATGELHLPIGLHAGLVFGVKLSGVLSQPAQGLAASVWGTNRLVDGWLGTAGLGGAWLLWRLLGHRLSAAGRPPGADRDCSSQNLA